MSTLFSKCQIEGEDFVNFHSLLRKHKLYQSNVSIFHISQKVGGIEIRMLIQNLFHAFVYYST